MFHVKHRVLLLTSLLVLTLLAAGCAAIQKPEGWAAPVEVGDRVLVQTAKGQVSLVDVGSGATVWTFPEDDSEERALYATPIVEGDTVYLADYSGRVTRLRITDDLPTQVWTAELGAHVVATPAYDGDSLYVPTADGRLVILGATSGDRTSTFNTSDRRIWGAPALGDGAIYLGDLDNGSTTALDLITGEVIWEQEISGPTAADFVLDGDLLLAGSFDQHLHALNVNDGGAERWAFAGDGWFLARPLVHDGVVYAATMTGWLYAIDRATGEQRWVFNDTEAQFRASPVIVGDRLIAIARDGRIFALNPATGDVAWTQDAADDENLNANPLVRGNEIFLVTSRHDLVRVDASSGAVTSVPLAAGR